MVRLKVAVNKAASLASSYFNSNMVRLKALNKHSGLVIASKFQFQHGAIKRPLK